MHAPSEQLLTWQSKELKSCLSFCQILMEADACGLQVPFGQFHTLALTLPRKYGPVTKLFMGAYPFVILTGKTSI